jgi:hypothetical protein
LNYTALGQTSAMQVIGQAAGARVNLLFYGQVV